MDWLSELLGAIAALVAIITAIVAAVPPFKQKHIEGQLLPPR